MIRLYVEGIGLRGPGLDGWEASQPIFAGTAAYENRPIAVPAAALLPANERRRAPQMVKLALATGAEAFAACGRSPAETAAIFASSGGDGETIHAILHTLAGAERALSPTRFHNSVHNVAAGYWSIATGARSPATSLCAHDGSFAAGLIEAGAQVMAGAAAVVLIAYDLPYPGPLASVRQIGEAFGVACVLAAEPSGHTIGTIDIDLSPGVRAPSPASPAALEPLRQSVPAARCLPLLAALAAGEPCAVMLDYLDDLALTVHVTPGRPTMTGMGRDAILGLIPHGGAMCLLDDVLHWDETGITCRSVRYAADDNPMRRADGRLGSAAGIEIASQAMALHGRLSAPAEGPPRPGFLVSLRDVQLRASLLPADIGPLTIVAHRLLGDTRGASYGFTVTAGEDEWLSGRATVLFEAGL